MINESMSLVTDRIEQKYLLDNEQIQAGEFRKNVVDTDLDKAVECLKKYMKVTGILSEETTPLMDIVVQKLKQESIQGQNTFLLATCFKNFLLSLPDNQLDQLCINYVDAWVETEEKVY